MARLFGTRDSPTINPITFTETVHDVDGDNVTISLKLLEVDDGTGFTTVDQDASSVSWLSFTTTETKPFDVTNVDIDVTVDPAGVDIGSVYRLQFAASDGSVQFTTTRDLDVVNEIPFDGSFEDSSVGTDIETTASWWTVPGGATESWFVSDDSQGVTDGSQCLQAKPIGDNETAEIELALSSNSSGNLDLDWGVSSESCCDFIEIYVDGVQELQQGGDITASSLSVSIGSGSHTVRFAYTKDGSVSDNKDTAFVDNIQLPNGTLPG